MSSQFWPVFWLQFWCTICALLGLGTQVFLFFIPKMKQKCAAANKEFSWHGWWKSDWNVVIGNILIIAFAVICFNEITNMKPGLLDKIFLLYGAIGFSGSSMVMAYKSKYEGSVMQLLDVKSNVSDTVTGKTDSVFETMTKGEEATGQVIQGPKGTQKIDPAPPKNDQ